MASNFTRNVLLVTAVLALSACKTVRSPDLPFPEITVSNFTVTCNPGSVAVGLTTQCTATGATCTTTTFDAQGNATKTTQACPATQWSANPTTVGTIDNTGTLTGVSPGTVAVTGNINGTTSTTNVTVTAACAKSVSVVASPANTSIPAGQSQRYILRATLSDGTLGDVSASTDWSLNPSDAADPTKDTGVASIQTQGAANPGLLSSDATLATATTIAINASYSANVCPGTASPLTGSASLTITPATILPTADGLCIEPATLANTFTGCRADTGTCDVSAQPFSLNAGQTQQFNLRARYNNGQECSVNTSASTTWGSSSTAILGVSNTGLATGAAPGTASVTASFAQPAPNPVATATPYPVTVTVSRVLGKNSLGVSGKDFPTATNPGPTKFACVGATNAVAGLQNPSQLQGQLNLIAKARLCDANKVGTDGNCTFAATDTYTDVTNDDGVTATTPNANQIVWTQAIQSSAYWDGSKCASSGGSMPSARVGDKQTPAARYPGDRHVDENGVVSGTGSLVAGFACITAQYTNPALGTASPIDGMTVLTLPVTNDDLLNPSATDPSQSPERLCDVLEPVFDLGGTNDGSGAVTQILSTVVGIVNPILQTIDKPGNPSPVTQVTNQLITALNPLTGALVTPIQQNLLGPVNSTVVQPLYCGLGTLLNGLLTLNPTVAAGAQACLPALP